jgi:hypothetical protein
MEGGVTMLLSELVALVESDVPAEGGVPSALQYEQAVKDAVRDFSERCGLKQVGTLSIVAGTATYTLPADFIKMIKLLTLTFGDGVLFSSQGLIAVPPKFTEVTTIRNSQITFHPIPTYSMARDFYYKAGWVLTEAVDEYDNAEYETLGEREGRIVLLKAKASALQKQVNAASGSVLKYSLGAVSVDKSSDVDAKATRSESLDKEYLSACENYNGQTIMAGIE